MMFVFEKIHERFSVKRNLFQAFYSGVFVVILGITIYQIVSFRNEINPYFEYEISYLNPFSNHLFFLTSGRLWPAFVFQDFAHFI